MPRFDLAPAELREYRPQIAEPSDFDDFWQRTLAESRAAAQEPTRAAVDSPLALVDVYDIEVSGFAGDRVRGWLVVPKDATEPLPTVVEFNGYGGGRGLPHERLAWAAAGYAWACMDTRGQGSGWGAGGVTPDPHGSGPATPGFMTRGIHDPDEYYYRRVYTDAALFVDAVRGFDEVDAARVAVTGASQGGGIAIAASGLTEGLVAVMPDVPFLCHFERAVGLTDSDPYQEIVRYLSVHRDAAARTFATLSYFDGANFAARATAPALYSVALMDPVCPPSTVYAAANRHLCGAEVIEYAFNRHEGGQGVQWERQAAWLAGQLAR
ncbi:MULTISPECIES: acetylxylan esterase [unclassified Microbacterium]|uniref:acetylxylan esterase n=1 Tax=unclassified Microbacterium TaxID=2609290 RepID=UPI000EAA2636|nr:MULTISPECIES: acetylxylan esterase [unclassified Microbacterium]MBT2484143.1 acetylxylan esterase [Microbacterium sp. ISL-108]RKN67088.1 acetylxylan esterase [Microbacterium sp. CGR2]